MQSRPLNVIIIFNSDSLLLFANNVRPKAKNGAYVRDTPSILNRKSKLTIKFCKLFIERVLIVSFLVGLT